jgi:hypothetical protein
MKRQVETRDTTTLFDAGDLSHTTMIYCFTMMQYDRLRVEFYLVSAVLRCECLHRPTLAACVDTGRVLRVTSFRLQPATSAMRAAPSRYQPLSY